MAHPHAQSLRQNRAFGLRVHCEIKLTPHCCAYRITGGVPRGHSRGAEGRSCVHLRTIYVIL